MSLSEGVAWRDDLAGVPSAKSLLLFPMALPFGFNQVERVLSASCCHGRGILRKERGGTMENSAVAGDLKAT